MSINKYIKKHQSIHKYISVLFFVSGITISLNLFKAFRPDWIYWQGHEIESWIPKIFLSQIITGATLSIALAWEMRKKHLTTPITTRGKTFEWPNYRLSLKANRYLLIFFMFLIYILRQFSTPVWEVSFVWLSFLLTTPIFLWILYNRFPEYRKYLVQGLLISLTLQALLAAWQSIFQKSFAPYVFFGEPQFKAYHQLATSALSNTIRVLPYGSTPHPNILAAWMLVGIIITWKSGFFDHKKWKYPLIALFLSTLLLTESVSAIASLIFLVASIIFTRSIKRATKNHNKNVFLKASLIIITVAFTLLVLYFPTDMVRKTRNIESISSIERRQNLLSIGFREILSHPWGTGIAQQITLYSPQDKAQLGFGFIQPIHNVWVLFVIENGIWTILLLFTFLRIDQKKYSSILWASLIISPILCLDHYIYTQYHGMLIAILIVIFCKKQKHY